MAVISLHAWVWTASIRGHRISSICMLEIEKRILPACSNKRVKKKVDVNGDGQIGPRERARGREVLRKRREATPPPKQSGRRGREATPPSKRQVRRGGN